MTEGEVMKYQPLNQNCNVRTTMEVVNNRLKIKMFLDVLPRMAFNPRPWFIWTIFLCAEYRNGRNRRGIRRWNGKKDSICGPVPE